MQNIGNVTEDKRQGQRRNERTGAPPLANLIDFAKMSAKGDIPEFEYGHI